MDINTTGCIPPNEIPKKEGNVLFNDALNTLSSSLEAKMKGSSQVPKREGSRVKGEMSDRLSDKYKEHIRRNSRDMLVQKEGRGCRLHWNR